MSNNPGTEGQWEQFGHESKGKQSWPSSEYL